MPRFSKYPATDPTCPGASVLPQVDANRTGARGLLRAEDVASLHRHSISGAHPRGVKHGRVRGNAFVGHSKRDGVAVSCSAAFCILPDQFLAINSGELLGVLIFAVLLTCRK